MHARCSYCRRSGWGRRGGTPEDSGTGATPKHLGRGAGTPPPRPPPPPPAHPHQAAPAHRPRSWCPRADGRPHAARSANGRAAHDSAPRARAQCARDGPLQKVCFFCGGGSEVHVSQYFTSGPARPPSHISARRLHGCLQCRCCPVFRTDCRWLACALSGACVRPCADGCLCVFYNAPNRNSALCRFPLAPATVPAARADSWGRPQHPHRSRHPACSSYPAPPPPTSSNPYSARELPHPQLLISCMMIVTRAALSH